MNLFIIFVAINCFSFHVRYTITSAENITSDVLQFDDLNYDVLFDICDDLEFKDLLSLTEVNSKYRELITRHYALKYRVQEKLVHLESWRVQKISLEDNSIKIYSTKLFVKFLRIFQQWISRIRMEDGYSSQVKNAMIEYCSESLTELSVIETYDKEVLLQRPFKNVTKLHLKLPLFSNKMNLSEIFPSLRHLHLEYVGGSILRGQSYLFPHLEHMEFPTHKQFSNDRIEPYVRFMELNPQIRNVHLNLMLDLSREGCFKLMQATNEKLPNLEVFELTLYTTDTLQHVNDLNEAIHFKNVKKLILHTYDEATELLPITFGQLEEIEVLGARSYLVEQTNIKWLSFIVKNHELRRILNIIYMLNAEQWKLIAEGLPLLEEIKTYWKSRDECSGLIDLMMNRKTNLEKVTLNMELSTENYTILSDLLYPTWQIVGEMKNIMREITFVRND